MAVEEWLKTLSKIYCHGPNALCLQSSFVHVDLQTPVASTSTASHLVSADDKLPHLRKGVRVEAVTKIAIDKRARASENREHEENCAGVLPGSGRLCGEKAAGGGDPDPASDRDPASHTESDAATQC